MFRLVLATLFAAAALLAANFKLYLQDGGYHLVREYKVEGDRVRYYTIERSDWEEIPLAIVDLKRTEEERVAREEKIRQDAAEIAAEEKFERELREEIERVPQNPGVYLLDGKLVKTVPLAKANQVTDKKRSVLKVISPIPIVSGRTTVELDGERSPTLVPGGRPEFYIRLQNERRISIVRMAPKKGAVTLILSQRYRPLLVFVTAYRAAAAMPTAKSSTSHQKSFKKPLTAMRNTVIAGRFWCISPNIWVIFGTTNATRKRRTAEPMKNMSTG